MALARSGGGRGGYLLLRNTWKPNSPVLQNLLTPGRWDQTQWVMLAMIPSPHTNFRAFSPLPSLVPFHGPDNNHKVL